METLPFLLVTLAAFIGYLLANLSGWAIRRYVERRIQDPLSVFSVFSDKYD